jgi:hypothetical protein
MSRGLGNVLLYNKKLSVIICMTNYQLKIVTANENIFCLELQYTARVAGSYSIVL